MQRSLAQLLFAAVLLLASSGVHAQSTQFLDAFAHPESVVIDAGTGTAYVSNIGTDLAPMAKDGDGFISKVTPDGIIESLRFLPRDSTEALHAPKGMAILAGTLYVADVDRIVGFDLSTRAQVFAVDLSGFGTQFLNDLAVFDGRTLLASATDIGTVFRVPVGDPPEATVLVEGIEGVNGVHVDSDNVLYTVSFGGDGGLRQIPLDAYATPTGSTACSPRRVHSWTDSRCCRTVASWCPTGRATMRRMRVRCASSSPVASRCGPSRCQNLSKARQISTTTPRPAASGCPHCPRAAW